MGAAKIRGGRVFRQAKLGENRLLASMDREKPRRTPPAQRPAAYWHTLEIDPEWSPEKGTVPFYPKTYIARDLPGQVISFGRINPETGYYRDEYGFIRVEGFTGQSMNGTVFVYYTDVVGFRFPALLRGEEVVVDIVNNHRTSKVQAINVRSL